jgi:hypothetical protein
MNAIVGIVRDQPHLTAVVADLKAAGFDNEISVIAPLPDPNITDANTPEGMASYLANLGEVTMPGLGPLLATGAFFAPFFGEMPNESTPDSQHLFERLCALGLSKEQAQEQDDHLRNGGILLAVQASDAEHLAAARGILDRHHVGHVLVGPPKP